MCRASVAAAAVVTLAALLGCRAQEGSSCVDGNRQRGTCITIRRCEPLRRLVQALKANTAAPNALQTLRQSICRLRSNSGILVCCANTPFGGGDPAPAPPPGGRPPLPLGGRPDLLPRRCGVTGLSDRIIDGDDAPLLAWPWMVLLRGSVSGQPSTWFCGGVLINDRYVLTAAHCFKPSLGTQLDFVRLGEHTLSKNPDCEKGLCAPAPQDIEVKEIILHSDYTKPCKECNDIALLRLASRAELNPLHVVPVCLPVDPLKEMGFTVAEFQNKFAWAAGWGSTARDPNRPVTPDKLQQVLLPIGEGSFCNSLRKDYPDPRSTLCAGGAGKDTCNGDSGGPLLLSNKHETRRYVVGITSLGPRVCGSLATQGLYSSVHFYVPWILQNLRP